MQSDRKNISVEQILWTQPLSEEFRSVPGLITFALDIPQWVAVELLTHKRLARNGSSSRAQSVKRHAGMGYYVPAKFHTQGTFMQGGEALPEDISLAISREWEVLEHHIRQKINEMNQMVIDAGYPKGIAKQEINRLLPTSKMTRYVITATESAWAAIRQLRTAPDADPAMQITAKLIAKLIDEYIQQEKFVRSDFHVPYAPFPVTTHQEYTKAVPLAAACLARVSNGAPGEGQRSDLELARDLLKAPHLSPFEHLAFVSFDPHTSALSSCLDDWGNEYAGWQNARSDIEDGIDFFREHKGNHQ